MNKQDPTTPKPANRPPSQFNKPQIGSIQVVVKVTEIEAVKKLIEEIVNAIEKVEDGDISKETAYMRITRAFDKMKQKIKERVAEEGGTT